MNYQEVFAAIPDAIVVVAPEPGFKILTATDAYLEVTMRRLEDIVGLKLIEEAFPDKNVPYNQNPVVLSLEKALNTKRTDSLDVIRYDLERPEGHTFEERYWEASHIPVLDEQGEVKCILQKSADVTERELAKRAQASSEEKFRFMTDMVSQLIHTADANGKLTYVNQRWINYTGLPFEEFLEKSWAEVVHPDDYGGMMLQVEKALQQKKGFQVEVRIKGKDGRYRWHIINSQPMLNENQDLIMRLGSTSDIHDTKMMVEELLATNEQMATLSDQVALAFQKAEAERLTLERLIMQAPAIFAIMKGPLHTFTLVNPHFQKLWPNRDFLGRTIAEVVPEVGEQGYISILNNVFATGEPFTADEIVVVMDWEATGKEEERFFTTTYHPLLEEGKITGIIVFGYEVTERVRLRQQLAICEKGLN
ncbi:PAS domain-containing protein [Pontibacter rugosus]|uniref:histidine kinase n=1 Tax=Pontibacter rugosus TaxID=1745966 RepID=A0ABW3STK6_9BACT